MTEAETPQAAPAAERGRRRTLVGRVVNNTQGAGRMAKTVVVEVVRSFRDPVYGKYVRRKKKFYAHDEKQEFRHGDTIEIQEHRPTSRLKRWIVTRLVSRPEEV